jgi:hypothetical protein
MLGRIRSRLTFANVCALLALMVALSTGTAYAANTVFSEDIVDGEVKTQDIHNNAVNSNKVAPDSLAAADLADGAVGSGEVLDDSLTSSDVAAGAVGSSEVLDESLTSADLATDSVQATEIADDSIDTGEIVDNSLFAADLAPGSVGTSEIADSSITGADVANNSLTTADLAGTDVHGKIAFSAGAVANGRCTNFDISVGGAIAGEGVVITLLEPVASGILIMGSRVPSNGHVTMPVCNFTGGTFPVITDLDIRIITFG